MQVTETLNEGLKRAIAVTITSAEMIEKRDAKLLDLKDKAPGVMAMGGSLAQAQGEAEVEVIETIAPAAPPPPPPSNAQAEALSALGNLGYAPGDAAGAVAQAAGDSPGADTPTLIRAALKLLAPKG